VILPDTGAVDNSTGGSWVRGVTRLAAAAGREGIESNRRTTPRQATGLGIPNSEECNYDTSLPLTLLDVEGNPVDRTYTAPVLDESPLPALFGLQSMIDNGAILDFRNMRAHFTGPRNTTVRTSTFEILQSPSGHAVIPCCNYTAPPDHTQPLPATLYHSSSSTDTRSTTTTSNATASNPEPSITDRLRRSLLRYCDYNLTEEEFSVLYIWHLDVAL